MFRTPRRMSGEFDERPWSELSKVRHIDPAAYERGDFDIAEDDATAPAVTFPTSHKRGAKRKPRKTYTCQWCGKQIESLTPRKFCCAQHQGLAKRNPDRWQKCVICTEPFRACKKGQVTCSRACGWVYRQKRSL